MKKLRLGLTTKWKYARSVLLMTLSGCMVGPDYKQPEDVIPDSWKTEEDTLFTNQPPIADWWKLFQDPLLDKYIEMTAFSNYDLMALEANVVQARAMRLIAAAPLFPQLIGDFNATHSYFSKNGPVFAIGLGSGSTTGGGGSTTSGTVGPITSGASSSLTGLPFALQVPQTQNLFNLLLDAAWEIDLFGKTRRNVQAAEAAIGQTIAERDDLFVTILAEVASNYMEIRSYQKQATLVEENIRYLEEKAALICESREEGLYDQLQLERIEAQLAKGRSALPLLVAQVYRGIYALSVLTGQMPETLCEELLPLQSLPKIQEQVAVGLRSDLIRRRPDIRIVERQLAIATSNIGIAVASFFPTFTLLGDIGLQSLLFPKLFQGNSLTYAYGADVSVPIFQGGSLIGNLRATKAAEKTAVYQYQQAVLKACQEAESAVATYNGDLKQKKWIEEEEQRQSRITGLTQEQYQNGLKNRLTLLDSQIDLISVELDLLQVQTKTLLDLIILYKSLGGGWIPFSDINCG